MSIISPTISWYTHFTDKIHIIYYLSLFVTLIILGIYYFVVIRRDDTDNSTEDNLKKHKTFSDICVIIICIFIVVRIGLGIYDYNLYHSKMAF